MCIQKKQTTLGLIKEGGNQCKSLEQNTLI